MYPDITDSDYKRCSETATPEAYPVTIIIISSSGVVAMVTNGVVISKNCRRHFLILSVYSHKVYTNLLVH